MIIFSSIIWTKESSGYLAKTGTKNLLQGTKDSASLFSVNDNYIIFRIPLSPQ